MKTIIALILSLSFANTFAAKTPSLESCLRKKDNLDREYCQKKRMRRLNSTFNKKYERWKKREMTNNQRTGIIKSINYDKDKKIRMIEMLNREIKLLDRQAEKVSKLRTNEDRANEERRRREEEDRRKRDKKDERKRKAKKFLKKIF